LKRKNQRNLISGLAARLRAPPKPGSFFEKKEPKKLHNGKLRFPKSQTIANSCRNSSAKRSFAQKFFASFFQERSGLGQRPMF